MSVLAWFVYIFGRELQLFHWSCGVVFCWSERSPVVVRWYGREKQVWLSHCSPLHSCPLNCLPSLLHTPHHWCIVILL